MDVALGDEAASLMRLIGGITMSAPSGFRFTLGQLMGVVAVSAVFLAVTTLSISGHHTSLFVISFSISLAGIAVFLQAADQFTRRYIPEQQSSASKASKQPTSIRTECQRANLPFILCGLAFRIRQLMKDRARLSVP